MADRSPSTLPNVLTTDQISDPAQVVFGVDKLDGTPGSYRFTAAELQKLSQRIDQVYNQQQNVPALTNATGAGKAYQVLPLPTQYVRNFGAGNITFPARTPGLLIHNGTVFTFYPFHSFSPATQIPNNDPSVSTIYNPTTGEAANFAVTNAIQGPTILYYAGRGTQAEPDYVWFVDRTNVLTCVSAPSKAGGKLYVMPFDYPAVDGAPTDTDAANYVQQEGIRGPALLAYVDTGTGQDPDFVWFVEGTGSVPIRIKDPSAGGGEGEPVNWGGIGGVLANQADLVGVLNGKQTKSANLDQLSSATLNGYGVGLLSLSSANDVAAAAGLAAITSGGNLGQLLARTGAQPGTIGWVDAPNPGGGGGSSSEGLFPVTATGDQANDNLAIAAAVTAAKSYGNGAVIEFRPNGVNREIYITSRHLFDQVSVSLQGAPGFRGFIATSQTSGFQWGSDILPWNYANVGTIPNGMARDTSQFDNPTAFILKVTATGGNYTLTFNGSTTGNILFSANAATILAALNAVPALNGKFTVTGSGTTFNFTPTYSGGLAGTVITGSATSVSLTGGTVTLTQTIPTVGHWYAFWSDTNVTDATYHQADTPVRTCELHRIGRQVIEARAFTVKVNATSGNYTVTINGQTTGNISATATLSQIQSAVSAVPALSGNITVTQGSQSNWFVFTATPGGTYGGIHNSMFYTNVSLSGGGATPVTVETSLVMNASKWLIDDTVYDPMVAGQSYFAEIPTIHNVRIKDINCRAISTAVTPGTFFHLNGCVNFEMKNIRMGDEDWRFNPGEITTMFSSGTQTDVIVGDHGNPNVTMETYYGIVDVCINRIVRTNVKFGAVRHGYTTAARARTLVGVTYRYGMNLNAVFEKCFFGCNPKYVATTATQESSACFDTHSESARVLLSNCQWVIPPNQVGAIIRSRDVTILNPIMHAADSAFPVVVYAKNFTMKGGVIDGGFYSRVSNSGTQPNVDNAKFIDVTWRNCGYTCLMFETGTDHRLDSCSFVDFGGGIVGSPWCPSAPVYVKSLTNGTTARLTVVNCTAPKSGNATAFLYPGPTITTPQLLYENNTTPGYSGAGNIGIARLTNAHAGEVGTSPNSIIAPTIEWEMLYGDRNGKPKYQYVQQSNHVLTTTELNKPITSLHEVYDDTSEDLVTGWLVDVPYYGVAGGGSGGWYILAPQGMTINAPKSLVSNTYNVSSESRELWWDASASSLVATRPNDSHPNATPLAYALAYSANVFQFTVPYRAVLAGSLATLSIDDAGNLVIPGGLLLSELQSAPGLTAANKALIYALDNSTKTRISARFSSNAAQTIATEA